MLTYNPPPQSPPEKDPLFDQAVELIQELGVASASLIQRHLKLGYARSARLLDELEQSGIIEKVDGAKPRKILIPYKNREGQTIIPKKEAEPAKIEFEETQASWNKTKYANKKSTDFEIELGRDEKKKEVNLNLDKYGNLLIIGSQFTGATELLNNILATTLAKYSPGELKLVVIDGIIGDIVMPNQAAHLLTPVIVDPLKLLSALKWAVTEIERRAKSESQKGFPKILILINSFNQISYFSPAETEDNLYQVIIKGKKYGFYLVMATDYLNPRISKELMANIPARLVFKATDKKVAHDSGIPESAELTSPDEAILETMFEGKKKLTIDKIKVKEIYGEIFK